MKLAEILLIEVMTALPGRQYSGHQKLTEEKNKLGITGKRSGARNVDDRLQVQLEEDGRESLM